MELIQKQSITVPGKMIYPVLMLGNILLFLWLKNTTTLFWATNIPIVIAALTITWLEKIHPHRKNWVPNRSDVKNDALYMVVVQMVLPRLLGFVITYTILDSGYFSISALEKLWPHHLPLLWQMILMVLFADFLRYWLHRLSHTNIPLWRLHAVHHSPEKLYWMNVGRFHPLEKALQYLFDALPFILAAVRPEVLALYYVFYAVNGFFQHCNIEMEMGFLNKIISGPQLHRWHHSQKISESNHNYGNNIIIWDILFGTYFYPPRGKLERLGLLNTAYPRDFSTQLWTPFSGKMDNQYQPSPKVRNMLINFLLGFKMLYIRHKSVKPFERFFQDAAKVQKKLLLEILQNNAQTEFGKEHGFDSITSLEMYQDRVPIREYEDLRPYIEKQGLTKSAVLTRDMPFMYNLTSGTTGKAKYIPVTRQSLRDLKKTQKIMAWYQYRSFPEAFKGKLMGIVSPAVEGRTSEGIPYGAASGHIYATMPGLARMKYILPDEVFAIENYSHKYYIMVRIALACADISFMASANPTTFHKIEETLRENREMLIQDLEEGSCRYLPQLDKKLRPAIERCIKKEKNRAAWLRTLEKEKLCLSRVWPCLRLIATWTKGSCGVALSSLLKNQVTNINVCDLGYLASELRGSINVDPGRGVEAPNLGQVFYEFCERRKWEEGNKECIGIHQLEPGKEYYVFITTKSGLYRYHINDILKVTGKWNNTATFEFSQKGKGVTNITGEKLCESQILRAMDTLAADHNLNIKFYKFLADEQKQKYRVFLEEDILKDEGSGLLAGELADELDNALCEINVEYRAKRKSGRLYPLVLTKLKAGSFESYKMRKLELGVREGQFKINLVEYWKDSVFEWDLYADSKN